MLYAWMDVHLWAVDFSIQSYFFRIYMYYLDVINCSDCGKCFEGVGMFWFFIVQPLSAFKILNTKYVFHLVGIW